MKKLLIFSFILVTGCTSHAQKPADSASSDINIDSQPAVFCPDDRPQACTVTADEQRVCGFIDTGVRCVQAPCPTWETFTYASGCSACTDTRVVGFSEGVCAQDADKPVNPENH